MRTMVALLAASLLLAGCSDGGGTQETPQDDLGLKATKDTGIIRGVVVDLTITPIANATVKVEGTDKQTQTNADGLFGFAEMAPGLYTLVASAPRFEPVRQSVEVVAGIDNPPGLRIQLLPMEGAQPMWIPTYYKGYLTCGVAIVVTSVGCTTFGAVASALGDQSIFPHDYDVRPDWVQGELVWRSTQQLSGAFIWEITLQGSNTHMGYRETAPSPALAYLATPVLENNEENIMERGINFRFFAGPHALCSGVFFGCGVTLEQDAEVFVHDFYHHVPPEGWRLTADGDPPAPE